MIKGGGVLGKKAADWLQAGRKAAMQGGGGLGKYSAFKKVMAATRHGWGDGECGESLGDPCGLRGCVLGGEGSGVVSGGDFQEHKKHSRRFVRWQRRV